MTKNNKKIFTAIIAVVALILMGVVIAFSCFQSKPLPENNIVIENMASVPSGANDITENGVVSATYLDDAVRNEGGTNYQFIANTVKSVTVGGKTKTSTTFATAFSGSKTMNDNFILVEDIVVNISGNSNATPGFCSSVTFGGIFDGAGHTITMYGTSEKSKTYSGGLVETLESSGVIRNLTVIANNPYATVWSDNVFRFAKRDKNINSKGNVYAGLFVGKLNGGLISNCKIDFQANKNYETGPDAWGRAFFVDWAGENDNNLVSGGFAGATTGDNSRIYNCTFNLAEGSWFVTKANTWNYIFHGTFIGETLATTDIRNIVLTGNGIFGMDNYYKKTLYPSDIRRGMVIGKQSSTVYIDGFLSKFTGDPYWCGGTINGDKWNGYIAGETHNAGNASNEVFIKNVMNLGSNIFGVDPIDNTNYGTQFYDLTTVNTTVNTDPELLGTQIVDVGWDKNALADNAGRMWVKLKNNNTSVYDSTKANSAFVKTLSFGWFDRATPGTTGTPGHVLVRVADAMDLENYKTVVIPKSNLNAEDNDVRNELKISETGVYGYFSPDLMQNNAAQHGLTATGGQTFAKEFNNVNFDGGNTLKWRVNNTDLVLGAEKVYINNTYDGSFNKVEKVLSNSTSWNIDFVQRTGTAAQPHPVYTVDETKQCGTYTVKPNSEQLKWGYALMNDGNRIVTFLPASQFPTQVNAQTLNITINPITFGFKNLDYANYLTGAPGDKLIYGDKSVDMELILSRLVGEVGNRKLNDAQYALVAAQLGKTVAEVKSYLFLLANYSGGLQYVDIKTSVWDTINARPKLTFPSGYNAPYLAGEYSAIFPTINLGNNVRFDAQIINFKIEKRQITFTSLAQTAQVFNANTVELRGYTLDGFFQNGAKVAAVTFATKANGSYDVAGWTSGGASSVWKEFSGAETASRSTVKFHSKINLDNSKDDSWKNAGSYQWEVNLVDKDNYYINNITDKTLDKVTGSVSIDKAQTTIEFLDTKFERDTYTDLDGSNYNFIYLAGLADNDYLGKVTFYKGTRNFGFLPNYGGLTGATDVKPSWRIEWTKTVLSPEETEFVAKFVPFDTGKDTANNYYGRKVANGVGGYTTDQNLTFKILVVTPTAVNATTIGDTTALTNFVGRKYFGNGKKIVGTLSANVTTAQNTSNAIFPTYSTFNGASATWTLYVGLNATNFACNTYAIGGANYAISGGLVAENYGKINNVLVIPQASTVNASGQTANVAYGLLAGKNNGQIASVSVSSMSVISLTASPNKDVFLGGVVGINEGEITFVNSFGASAAELTVNTATTKNSFAISAVGGIVGVANGGTINNCKVDFAGKIGSFNANTSGSNYVGGALGFGATIGSNASSIGAFGIKTSEFSNIFVKADNLVTDNNVGGKGIVTGRISDIWTGGKLLNNIVWEDENRQAENMTYTSANGDPSGNPSVFGYYSTAPTIAQRDVVAGARLQVRDNSLERTKFVARGIIDTTYAWSSNNLVVTYTLNGNYAGKTLNAIAFNRKAGNDGETAKSYVAGNVLTIPNDYLQGNAKADTGENRLIVQLDYDITVASAKDLGVFLSGEFADNNERYIAGAKNATLANNIVINANFDKAIVVRNTKKLSGGTFAIELSTNFSKGLFEYETPFVAYDKTECNFVNYYKQFDININNFGRSFVGGFVAVNCGALENLTFNLTSSSVGTVGNLFDTESQNKINGHPSAIGGIVGYNSGSLTNITTNLQTNLVVNDQAMPQILGGMVGMQNGGSLAELTLNGEFERQIANFGGGNGVFGYLGGFVGVINLMDAQIEIGGLDTNVTPNVVRDGLYYELKKVTSVNKLYYNFLGKLVGGVGSGASVVNKSYIGVIFGTGAIACDDTVTRKGTLNVVYVHTNQFGKEALDNFACGATTNIPNKISVYGALSHWTVTGAKFAPNYIPNALGVLVETSVGRAEVFDQMALEHTWQTNGDISFTYNKELILRLNSITKYNGSVVSDIATAARGAFTIPSGYLANAPSGAKSKLLWLHTQVANQIKTDNQLNNFLLGVDSPNYVWQIATMGELQNDLELTGWSAEYDLGGVKKGLELQAGRILDGKNFVITLNRAGITATATNTDAHWNTYAIGAGLFVTNNGIWKDTKVNIQLASGVTTITNQIGSANANYVFGGLVGINNNKISNITVQNYIAKESFQTSPNGIVGGLVGVNKGVIADVDYLSHSGNIIETHSAGELAVGLVAGANDGGQIAMTTVLANNALQVLSGEIGATTRAFVGGLVGIGSNDGANTFGGITLSPYRNASNQVTASLDKIQVVVKGGIGVTASGNGLRNNWGSRGYIAGSISSSTEKIDNVNPQMSGIVYVDYLTSDKVAIKNNANPTADNPNGLKDDAKFNNDSNGRLSMFGRVNTTIGAKCDVSTGGTIHIVAYDDFDILTENGAVFGDLITYWLSAGDKDKLVFNFADVVELKNTAVSESVVTNFGKTITSADKKIALDRNSGDCQSLGNALATAGGNILPKITYKFGWDFQTSKAEDIKGFILGSQYQGASLVANHSKNLSINANATALAIDLPVTASRVFVAGRKINGNGANLNVNISGSLTAEQIAAGVDTRTLTPEQIAAGVTNRKAIGGLYAQNFGEITNINLNVTMNGLNIAFTDLDVAIGAIVGVNSGIISSSNLSATMNGTITSTMATNANITLAVGGLVGCNDKELVNNISYNINQNNLVVKGMLANVGVGGIAGINNGEIWTKSGTGITRETFSTAVVANTTYVEVIATYSSLAGVGGLVGINNGAGVGANNTGATISNINFTSTHKESLVNGVTKLTVTTTYVLTGGATSAVGAMGGAIGFSGGGAASKITCNSYARLVNGKEYASSPNIVGGVNKNTIPKQESQFVYLGGFVGLASNAGKLSVADTSDAFAYKIGAKTFELDITMMNNVVVAFYGNFSTFAGAYVGLFAGRVLNAPNKANLRGIVWVDYKQGETLLFAPFKASESVEYTPTTYEQSTVFGTVTADQNTAWVNMRHSPSDLTHAVKWFTTNGENEKHYQLINKFELVNEDGAGARIKYTLVAIVQSDSTVENFVYGANVSDWMASKTSSDYLTTLESGTKIKDTLTFVMKNTLTELAATTHAKLGNYLVLRIQISQGEVIISTPEQLTAFISSKANGKAELKAYADAKKGSIANNITLTQEPNRYNFNKELLGGGYKITLVPMYTAGNPDPKEFEIKNLDGNHRPTDLDWSSTPIYDDWVYYSGMFVGAIGNNGKLKNIVFEFNSELTVTNEIKYIKGNKYGATNHSLVTGIVTAVCAGYMESCTLNLGPQTKYINYRRGESGGNPVVESKKLMSIAGGFAGFLVSPDFAPSTSKAQLVNCTLNMADTAELRSLCMADKAKKDFADADVPRMQAVMGGMVGYMGLRSYITNAVVNGGGYIEAASYLWMQFTYAWDGQAEEFYFFTKQIYRSAAGAVVGLNSVAYGNNQNQQDKNEPYQYTNVTNPDNIGMIDGVIHNWYGFTMEFARRIGKDKTKGGYKELDYVLQQETAYRQIAGNCDYFTRNADGTEDPRNHIRNVYVVSKNDWGKTPRNADGSVVFKKFTDPHSPYNEFWLKYDTPEMGFIVDWDNTIGTGNWWEWKTWPDQWYYNNLSGHHIDGGYKVPNDQYPYRYIGRGAKLGTELTRAYELYIYDSTKTATNTDNTNPATAREINDKNAGNLTLEWASIGVGADIRFNFKIFDKNNLPRGKFLWDVQGYDAKPAKLLTSTPTTALDPNKAFYESKYDKIATLGEATEFATYSQVIDRGRDWYLYYSFGSAGTASVDTANYFHDKPNDVYYNKVTTPYGGEFGLPQLKIVDSNGNPLSGSLGAVYKGIEVFSFKDVYQQGVTKGKKVDIRKVGEGANTKIELVNQVAGSYYVNFTASDISKPGISAPVVDVDNQTIIFPDGVIASSGFRLIEIITPISLTAESFAIVKEFDGGTGAGNAIFDVKTNPSLTEQLPANVKFSNANVKYTKDNTYGFNDVSFTVAPWKYYSYQAASSGLGYNNVSMISNRSGTMGNFMLDMRDSAHIKISGNTATISGRGVIVPQEIDVSYAQKTFDNNTNVASTQAKLVKHIGGADAGAAATNAFLHASSFGTYASANASNNINLKMKVTQFVFNIAGRANYSRYMFGNSNCNYSYVDANSQGVNAVYSVVGNDMTLLNAGTIVPVKLKVEYLAKEYDGTTVVDYSRTNNAAQIKFDPINNALKPKATFATANVVYGGAVNKYNAINFETKTITDKINNVELRAFVNTADGTNNYCLDTTKNACSPNGATTTVAERGLIIPKNISLTSAVKTFDNNANVTYGAGQVTFAPTTTHQPTAVFDNANAADAKTVKFTQAQEFLLPNGLTGDLSTNVYIMDSDNVNCEFAFRPQTDGSWQAGSGFVFARRGFVNPKKVDVTNARKTYDGTTTLATDNFTLNTSQIVAGAPLTVNGSLVKADVSSSANVNINVTSLTVKGVDYQVFAGNSNYFCKQASGVDCVLAGIGIVIPRLITLGVKDRVYNGSDSVTLGDITFGGLVSGATVLNVTGAYDNRHVGVSKIVTWKTTAFVDNGSTYNRLVDSGATTEGVGFAGNYCVNPVTSSATITKAPITADMCVSIIINQMNGANSVANGGSGTRFEYFDTATYVSTAQLAKKNPADDVTIVCGDNATNGIYNVGAYAVTVKSITGADAGDYELTAGGLTTSGKFEIYAQTVTTAVVKSKPINVIFGQTLPDKITGATVNATDKISGNAVTGSWTITSFSQTSGGAIGGWDINVNTITCTNNNYVVSGISNVKVTPVVVNGDGTEKALYIIPINAKLESINKIYNGTTAFDYANADLQKKTVATVKVGATTIELNPKGSFVNKNVMTNGKVSINVKTFGFFDTNGTKQIKYRYVTDGGDTNYSLESSLNNFVVNTNLAEVNGVGNIAPYALTANDISVTDFAQTINAVDKAGSTFEYRSVASYKVNGYTVNKFAQGDNFALTFELYNSTDSGHSPIGVGAGAGTYYAKATAIVSQTPANNYVITNAVLLGNKAIMTIAKQAIVESNIKVVGNNQAFEYNGGAHTYSSSSLVTTVTDKDGNIVNGALTYSDIMVGALGEQINVGRYLVALSAQLKVDANGNYSFDNLKKVAINLATSSGARAEMAVVPKVITFGDFVKVYDGNDSYAPNTDYPLVVNGLVGVETLSPVIKFVTVDSGVVSVALATTNFQYYKTGETTLTSATRVNDSGTVKNYAVAEVGAPEVVYAAKGVILPRPITVGAYTKVYDGTANVTAIVPVTGSVGGASLSLGGVFASHNVGSNIALVWNSAVKEFRYNNLTASFDCLVDSSAVKNGTNFAGNYYLSDKATFGNITQFVLNSTHFANLAIDGVTGASVAFANNKSYAPSTLGGKINVGSVPFAVAGMPNWTANLLRADETFAINITIKQGGATAQTAHNAGAYVFHVEIVSPNYTLAENTVSYNFTIAKQVVTADKFAVTMDIFEINYAAVGYNKPLSNQWGAYAITFTDSSDGTKITPTAGQFVINELVYTDKKVAEITSQTNSFIDGYTVWASAISGENENYSANWKDVATAVAVNVDALSGKQSLTYYIVPGELKLASVEKTYDGTTDITATTTFNFASGTPSADLGYRFVAKYSSRMATHSSLGASLPLVTERGVEIKFVAKTINGKIYNVAILEGGAQSNYFVAGSIAGEYVKVDGIAKIKKYVITGSEQGYGISVNVTGYVEAPTPGKVVKNVINANDTLNFVYAFNHKYDGENVKIVSLGMTLFNSLDSYATMITHIVSDGGSGVVTDAGSYVLKLSSIESDNYELTNKRICSIVIAKQNVGLEQVTIKVPYINHIYDASVVTVGSTDYTFTVKDKFNGSTVLENKGAADGVTKFEFVDANGNVVSPVNVGRYGVDVTVNVTALNNKNYAFPSVGGTMTYHAQNGEAVCFVLPRTVVCESVVKNYDANDSLGVKTFAPTGFLGDDATTFVAMGRYLNKNVSYKVVDGKAVYNDVLFTAQTFVFYDVATKRNNTAYFVPNSNYTIAGVGQNNNAIRVSGVGVIIPHEVVIGSVEKGYDGTTELSYGSGNSSNANASYEKGVTGLVYPDTTLWAKGRYSGATEGVWDLYLEFKEFVYGGKTYLTLINAHQNNKANACNYFVANVTPTGSEFKYIGKGTIVDLTIGGPDKNAQIIDVQIKGADGFYHAFDDPTAFVFASNKSYTVSDFRATLKFETGKSRQFDGNTVAGILDGDTLTFGITYNSSNSVNNVGSYSIRIVLVSSSNNSYKFDGMTLSSFNIIKQTLDETNIKAYIADFSKVYCGEDLLALGDLIYDGLRIFDKNGTAVTANAGVTFADFRLVNLAKGSAVNVGLYRLQVSLQGFSHQNYQFKDNIFVDTITTAGASTAYNVTPKPITLDSKTLTKTLTFSGGIIYKFELVTGEVVIVGDTSILPANVLVGTRTIGFAPTILNVEVYPNAANQALIAQGATFDPKLNYTLNLLNTNVDGKLPMEITILPSNNLVAERVVNGVTNGEWKIVFALTDIESLRFVGDIVDTTTLSNVLKVALNQMSNFGAVAMTALSEIVLTNNISAVNRKTFTITGRFKTDEASKLDSITYSDRYAFAVGGAQSSTNIAVTSSELADGQSVGYRANGVAIGSAKELFDFLKVGSGEAHLVNNIYGFDNTNITASAFNGKLYGNGFVIQLAGGGNKVGGYCGGFVGEIGAQGLLADINFKYNSSVKLSGDFVGLVAGKNGGSVENCSLEILSLNSDSAKIGGFVGQNSGTLVNVSVVFGCNITAVEFGGMAFQSIGGRFEKVSVLTNNKSTVSGSALVRSITNTAVNGFANMMMSSPVGTAGAGATFNNVYSYTAFSLGGQKANGELKMLETYVEGFVNYYFAPAVKSGSYTHNVYGQTAVEQNKTYYENTNTTTENIVVEVIAPINRFIWEAFSTNYKSLNSKDIYVGTSLNRYVAVFDIGAQLHADGYTGLDGVKKVINFVTSGGNLFTPAIGIRGTMEIAISGSVVKEVEYNGLTQNNSITITVDGAQRVVTASGTDVGYYDQIAVEVGGIGDTTIGNEKFNVDTRTAIVVSGGGSSTIAGAVLIIYPRQETIPASLATDKIYDSTALAEVPLTLGGNALTLNGNYYDTTNNLATSVANASKIGLIYNGSSFRKVLVNKTTGEYIARVTHTDKDGKITYTYQPIKVRNAGGLEEPFDKNTLITSYSVQEYMRAFSRMIDFDKALADDATIGTNVDYSYAYVYNIIAEKAATGGKDYFGTSYYYIPSLSGVGSQNFALKDATFAIGALGNIWIGAQADEVAILQGFESATLATGTTTLVGHITPLDLTATYSSALEQSYRSAQLAQPSIAKGIFSTPTLPRRMTAAQKAAFEQQKLDLALTGVDVFANMLASGISFVNGKYVATDQTQYQKLALPSQITYGNYRMNFSAQSLILRYFFFDELGRCKIEKFADFAQIGTQGADYHTLSYVLTRNINGKSNVIAPFAWTVDGVEKAFEGTLDGAGFELTNFVVIGGQKVAIFAQLGSTAVVKNITFGNVIIDSRDKVSAEVGIVVVTNNGGAVTNVTAEGSIVTNGATVVTKNDNLATSLITHRDMAKSLNQLYYNNVLIVGKLTAAQVTSLQTMITKFVLRNSYLTMTNGKVIVQNYRQYWTWVNVCPWLTPQDDVSTIIRPTK